MRNIIWSYLLLLCLTGSVLADSPSRDENIVSLRPYDGISVQGVDTSTLSGKVMCGYQGWFTTPDDGAQKGWTHYGRRGRFEPGSCTIDLWPDVSELEDDEKFATAFRHADGSVAYVFSSLCHKTVQRHFSWMREYGIDGAFVQRFAVETFRPSNLNSLQLRLDALPGGCQQQRAGLCGDVRPVRVAGGANGPGDGRLEIAGGPDAHWQG